MTHLPYKVHTRLFPRILVWDFPLLSLCVTVLGGGVVGPFASGLFVTCGWLFFL